MFYLQWGWNSTYAQKVCRNPGRRWLQVIKIFTSDIFEKKILRRHCFRTKKSSIKKKLVKSIDIGILNILLMIRYKYKWNIVLYFLVICNNCTYGQKVCRNLGRRWLQVIKIFNLVIFEKYLLTYTCFIVRNKFE